MDCGSFSADKKLNFLESDDETNFDISKFLTTQNQNFNNNSSKCSTEDICAQSIRAAFIMAENESEIQMNNNELLSELSSVTNDFFTRFNNENGCFTEDPLDKNMNQINENNSQDENAIFSEYLNTNFAPDVDNILPTIPVTKNMHENNICMNTSIDFITAVDSNNINFESAPIYEGNYDQNGNHLQHSFKQPAYITSDIMKHSVPMFNTIQTSDNKKPKRKRAASDREKNRTQSVNTAFQKLRTLIPTEPVDRKLSKVETLRLAISYITHLGSTLEADVSDDQPCMRKCARFEWETEKSVCTFCMSNTKTLLTRDGFTN